MYGNGHTKKVASCFLSVFNGAVLLAQYYTMVIVLFGVFASPNIEFLSNYNTRHIRILTCLDDFTAQKSEICIVRIFYFKILMC